METLTATSLRKQFFQTLKNVEDYHTPIRIPTRKRGVVLVAAAEWDAIQETLYLASSPKTLKELKEGMQLPHSACEAVEW
jgi:prevent-host-death family protein